MGLLLNSWSMNPNYLRVSLYFLHLMLFLPRLSCLTSALPATIVRPWISISRSWFKSMNFLDFVYSECLLCDLKKLHFLVADQENEEGWNRGKIRWVWNPTSAIWSILHATKVCIFTVLFICTLGFKLLH